MYNLGYLFTVVGILFLHAPFSCAAPLISPSSDTHYWQINSSSTENNPVFTTLNIPNVLQRENSLVSASSPEWVDREVWVTIFVHGIMSIKPHVSASNFLRFMTDDVRNTVYSKTVEKMRNAPIF